MKPNWDDLMQRYLDGQTAEEETRRLEAALKADDALADRYLRHLEVEVALEANASSAGATRELLTAPGAREPGRGFAWFSWHPLTAAAAGLAIGLFGASVAWGMVSPRPVATALRLFSLNDGGFEDGAVGAGFPRTTGVWSGDEAEVVLAEGKGAPEGRRSLRFAKAEGDASDPERQAIACDVFQIVDLRPLRSNLGSGGDSVLELSASFLDARGPNEQPSVTFFCQMYLFTGDAAKVHQAWTGNIPAAIASGSAEVTTLGGHGAWKQLTAKSLVSAEADFAVVQISARPNLRVPMPPRLFVDDVKLTLKTQPTLPVRVQR